METYLTEFDLTCITVIRVSIIRNSKDFSHNLHVCRLALMRGKFILKLSVNSSIERCKCYTSEEKWPKLLFLHILGSNGLKLLLCFIWIKEKIVIGSAIVHIVVWYIVSWVSTNWYWALMQPRVMILLVFSLKQWNIHFL